MTTVGDVLEDFLDRCGADAWVTADGVPSEGVFNRQDARPAWRDGEYWSETDEGSCQTKLIRWFPLPDGWEWDDHTRRFFYKENPEMFIEKLPDNRYYIPRLLSDRLSGPEAFRAAAMELLHEMENMEGADS